MKKIDNSGLILCDLQARAFELSLDIVPCSSEIFIRRFMKSNVAKELDSDVALNMVVTPKDIIERVEEQYGKTTYGSVKHTANEMFWLGYVYRYFAYTYDISSSQAYKIIKPKELKELYPAYHTMDCANAIERFLEAKDVVLDGDIERQYRLYRRMRANAVPISKNR